MPAAEGVRFVLSDADLTEFKRSILLFPRTHVRIIQLVREAFGHEGTMTAGLYQWYDPIVTKLVLAGALVEISDVVAKPMYERERHLRTMHAATNALMPEMENTARQIYEETGDSRAHLLGYGILQPRIKALEHDIQTREAATALESQHGTPFVPLVRSLDVGRPAGGTKADLVHVVLKRLPLPDDSTPWEAVLEWRADAESQDKYRRLIAAIGDAARRGLAPPDFDDELATKLDDYERAMSIHHQRMSLSTLEVFFVTMAEFAEHLAHLRFGGAIKTVLEMRHRELDILQAELSAPGREFAYIANARSHFG